MIIARIENNAIAEMREVPQDWYEAAVAANNPKVIGWLPVVPDAKPEITPLQKLIPEYVIELTRVVVHWIISDDQDAIANAARQSEIENTFTTLRQIRDSPGTLTGAQLSGAVRALSKAVLWIGDKSIDLFQR